MPRKFHKYKLLLDEGFHLRNRLPILNSRFNVKHVAADYKQIGLSDSKVYELANKEDRLLVTYNIKDFRKLLTTRSKTGVIGVSSNLTVEQIDKKLTALLTKSTKKELYGKFIIVKREVEM